MESTLKATNYKASVIEKVQIECDEKLNQYKNKLNASFSKKVEKYSLSHSEVETKSFSENEQKKIDLKVSKKQNKYTKLMDSLTLNYAKKQKKIISEESLRIEREERTEKYKNKCDKKLAKFTLKSKEPIEKKCESFALSHSEEETKEYRISLEQEVQKEANILSNKYNQKVAKYKKHLERRSADVLASSKRIWEVDLLRGIAIWGMMIDHYLYDFYGLFAGPNAIFKNWSDPNIGFLAEMQKIGAAYYTNDVRIFIRLFGVFLFIFLCGVSCRFSKNNLRRGIGLVGLGLIVTAALYTMSAINKDQSLMILLSTLTTIGLCVLTYTGVSALCKKLFKPENWKWICLGFAVGILVFWGFMSFFNCYYNVEKYRGAADKIFGRFFYIFNNNIDDVGYIIGFNQLATEGWWKPILGFKAFGADWLGLFPYVGYVFLGGFVGETVYKDKKSIFCKYYYPRKVRTLSSNDYLMTKQGQFNGSMNCKLGALIYPGKHTLLCYIFHQPVFMIIMVPILLAMGYRLSMFG